MAGNSIRRPACPLAPPSFFLFRQLGHREKPPPARKIIRKHLDNLKGIYPMHSSVPSHTETGGRCFFIQFNKFFFFLPISQKTEASPRELAQQSRAIPEPTKAYPKPAAGALGALRFRTGTRGALRHGPQLHPGLAPTDEICQYAAWGAFRPLNRSQYNAKNHHIAGK